MSLAPGKGLKRIVLKLIKAISVPVFQAGLFDGNSCRLHHFFPSLDFRADLRAEFFRRAADDFEAFPQQTLFVGVLTQGGVDVAVQLLE